ncbi:tail fiber assembly protein [Escherichia coli]|uniref:tail fiber assembly protein n=1 Tax=Escherichia coli TaxID=562 RepID=UPI000B1642FA|nr:tail fiber assembly protein [Escherichia coli]
MTAAQPKTKNQITKEKPPTQETEMPTTTKEKQRNTAELEKQQLINQANDYMNSKQWPRKQTKRRMKADELQK